MDDGNFIAVKTKIIRYRQLVRVINYLQAHKDYKNQIQPPAYLSPPATPWKATADTSKTKEGLSIAVLAELQDTCDAECQKWLHLRETGRQLVKEGATLPVDSDGRLNTSGLSDDQRLAFILAHLDKNNNLCDYLRDRSKWFTRNIQCNYLLGKTEYKSIDNMQLPTAILRSDGARRAFPRHLPSLKNSESMSAWIGVICRSSAKSN